MVKPISPKLRAYYEQVKARAEERFWSRVDKSGGPDACWPWMGARYAKGYGHVCFRGIHRTATRVACEIVGKILPDGLFWLHSCDYPPCCNPAHLFSGTKKDNGEDAKRKGRTAIGVRNGMHTHPEARMVGERNPQAILTEMKVRQIRADKRRGKLNQKQFASKYRVSQMTVSLIVRGIIWIGVRGQQSVFSEIGGVSAC